MTKKEVFRFIEMVDERYLKLYNKAKESQNIEEEKTLVHTAKELRELEAEMMIYYTKITNRK